MADGVWTMDDGGGFEMSEPYATWLREARAEATRGWASALIGYLERRSPYSARELARELDRRNRERPEGATAEGKLTVFEEFVIEALSGDL